MMKQRNMSQEIHLGKLSEAVFLKGKNKEIQKLFFHCHAHVLFYLGVSRVEAGSVFFPGLPLLVLWRGVKNHR